MTISSLRIQNFQAHSDLLIELDPGVTTIVGPSDVGKSSAIRALRWAALNYPVSSLIRDGAKQAVVELIVDGRKIVRSRGAENIYRLDDQEYKAFRTDVPDAIAKLLNLTDANFQGQHDPIYWFSSTAGDVSRQLNAVVDLGVIDSTLAETVRFVNKAKTVMQIAEETLSRSVAERDGLAWVADADADLKKVEQKAEVQDKLKDRLLDLNAMVTAANDAKEDAKEARLLAADSEKLLSMMAAFGRASKKVAELDVLITVAAKYRDEKNIKVPDLSKLNALADRVVEIGQAKKAHRLAELISYVKDAKKRRVGEVPDLFALSVLADALEVKTDKRQQLEQLLNEVYSKNDNVEDTREEFERSHKELELKTEGRCPFCGKEMDE